VKLGREGGRVEGKGEENNKEMYLEMFVIKGQKISLELILILKSVVYFVFRFGYLLVKCA
jgi:hypothetical protein